MPSEPTLSEVHADLVGRLEQDKRLRALESSHASLNATMTAALTNLAEDREESRRAARDMEQRLTDANKNTETRLAALIESVKPKPPWPAVAAVAAVCMVTFALFALIYTHH